MMRFLKSLSNRAYLVLDLLTRAKLDAHLLFCLRELTGSHQAMDKMPDDVADLLARGASPTAKSVLGDARNATDLTLWIGPAVARHLLAAGGKPGRSGVGHLAVMAEEYLDCYDMPEKPFLYADVAALCIKAHPGAPWWHEVFPGQGYHKRTAIGRLECARPGSVPLLEAARRACGLEGKRAMSLPVGRRRLDSALVRTLKNLELDCNDEIDDSQRRDRVAALLKLGANPNAATPSGRAMGCAINTLDAGLVELLRSHGGQACHQDMEFVLEDRIGQVDYLADFKLKIDEEIAQALFGIVAACFPPRFSWDYNFEINDWLGDAMVVNMQSAMGDHYSHLKSIQEADLLGSNTLEIAGGGPIRRL